MQKIPAFPTTRVASALLAAATLMPVITAHAGESLYSGNSSALAQREAIRRQQAVAEADQLLVEGREAYAAADFDKSVTKYKQALAKLPPAPVLDDRRTVIKQHLVDASIALAGQHRKVGKYTEARALLDFVLSPDVDPGNGRAQIELGYLDDPIRTNPALTYEHTQNVDKVRRALYMGEGHYNLGKYDDAMREFESVLRIDPYNKAARRWMERIAGAKSDYYRSAYDQTRAELLMEVDRAWELAVPRDVPVAAGGDVMDPRLTSGSALIMEKLRSIIIPVIDFEDTSVEEAVDFLRTRSRELDTTTTNPADKGINFVVRKPQAGAAAAAADSSGLDAAAGALAAPSDPGALRVRELRLTNVPVATALKYICDSTKLKYKVDDFAVTLVPASDDGEDIVTRSFQVPPDFLDALNDGGGGAAETSSDPFATAPEAGGVSGLKPRGNVQDLLKTKGVPFPEKASANFIAANSTLVVRNTPTNLDLIEQIVDAMKIDTPKQIKIMTKFVEISQENNEELGFDWIVTPFGLGADLFGGGGTIGSGTPRGNADFINPVNFTTIDGIPANPGQNVNNIVTGGNRSGTAAITRDSISAILNNPDRTAQNVSVAPGILSLTGLFSDGQVQMIMRGLSQKKGADIMTAPSIMAKSGQKATIEIIREFIYPTEYEPPELPQQFGGVGVGGGVGGVGGLVGGGGGQGFPVTPATPTAFEPRNTGVTLEIEPTLGNNDSVIDLRFAPEIVEFEGFINYGSPIEAPSSDALGNPTTVTITENRIEMPVFSVRRVSTSLSIYDGHTVAVGGLMREDVQNVEDKVPVLGDIPLVGRLFQSKAENRIKSNLIIFVTAQIIDATGRVMKDSAAPMGAPDIAPASGPGGFDGTPSLLPPVGN
jgi:general secretion pathway protein D